MSELNNSFFSKFIEDPDHGDLDWNSLNSSEKETLLDLEEMIVRFQLLSNIKHNDPGEDDLSFVSRFLDGLKNTSAPVPAAEMMQAIMEKPSRIHLLQKMLQAIRVMKKSEYRPVPESLMNVIRADLEKNAAGEKLVPGIVVRMGEKALHVIKSTMQGFQVLDTEAVPVRSAGAVMDSSSSRVQLQKREKDGDVIADIMLESPGYLTLVLRFPGKKGQLRIQLKKDGRIVDLRNVDAAIQAVDFRSLNPGSYEIVLSGAIRSQFEILVHEEEL